MGKRGRGHRKVEQDGVEKRIHAINSTLVLYLPKRLKQLGVTLNQKVLVRYEVADSNPLNWELKIVPVPEGSRRQNKPE